MYYIRHTTAQQPGDHAAAQAALALSLRGAEPPGQDACAAARRARAAIGELEARGVAPLWAILTEDLPPLEATCTNP